jgi:outer membrane protein assembly factor BamB
MKMMTYKKTHWNKLIIKCTFLYSLLLVGCDGNGDPNTPPAPSVDEKVPCLTSSTWSYSAAGKVRSTAAVDADFVYFGDSEGNLYSVNKVSGELNWQVSFKGAFDSKLVLVESTLLAVSDDGQLLAVDVSDGSEVWQTEIGKMSRSEYDYNISSPTIHDGKAFIGQENGDLIGVDLRSGEIVWQVNLLSPSHSQPIIVDGSVCISSMTDLSCVDLSTKNIIWSQTLDWPTSPASDGTSLIVGSRWDYGVYSFDLKTGVQNWKHTVVDWAPAEPIIHENIIYIGSSDNHAFLAIDLKNGERLWRAEAIANVFTKAVIFANSIIYSSGYAYNTPGFGVVKAVDFEGEDLWSLPGCNFFSSPIIDESSIFIGSDDGYFYSLDVDNS